MDYTQIFIPKKLYEFHLMNKQIILGEVCFDEGETLFQPNGIPIVVVITQKEQNHIPWTSIAYYKVLD